MSALPMDLPLAEVSATTPRWVPVRPALRSVPNVPARPPLARPLGTSRPAGRPGGVAAPSLRPAPAAIKAAGLRLTRRGLAVVVGGFIALMATAVVVLVTSFLAVSNDPIVTGALLG